jgi:hypothetical protein
VPVPATVTPASLAADPRLGPGVAAGLRRWAPLLDAALFARAEPGPHLAAEAWRADAAVARALRAAAPRRRRLRAALDPRPLARRGRAR